MLNGSTVSAVLLYNGVSDLEKTITKDMTTGSEWRHIVLFTLPLLAGNLLQQVYNIADTIIVGQYLGDDALAAVGGRVLLKTLDCAESGTLKPQKQDDSLSSYASMLSKKEGELDWNDSAEHIYNRVRGLNPWPGAFSYLCGKRFMIDFAYPEKECGKPGEVLRADDEGILVACGDESVRIKSVKFDGKKKMTVSQYLNGHKIEKGTVLGKE